MLWKWFIFLLHSTFSSLMQECKWKLRHSLGSLKNKTLPIMSDMVVIQSKNVNMYFFFSWLQVPQYTVTNTIFLTICQIYRVIDGIDCIVFNLLLIVKI